MQIFQIWEIKVDSLKILEQIDASDIVEACLIAKNKYPYKAIRVSLKEK